MQKAFPAQLRSGKSWDCRPLLELPISKTYWERATCQDGRVSAGWDGGLGAPHPQSCPGNERGWLWDVHRNLALPCFPSERGFCGCSSSLRPGCPVTPLRPGCSAGSWRLPVGFDKMSSKPNPQTKQVLVSFRVFWYGQWEQDVIKASPLPSPGLWLCYLYSQELFCCYSNTFLWA